MPQHSVSQTGRSAARVPASRSSDGDLVEAEPLAAVRLGDREREQARSGQSRPVGVAVERLAHDVPDRCLRLRGHSCLHRSSGRKL